MRRTGLVARNAGFVLLTNVGTRLLTPVLLIYAARSLGVHRYGQLSFMIEFATLGLALSSFGSDHGFYALLLRTGATSERQALQSYPVMRAILGVLYAAGGVVLLGVLRLVPTAAPGSLVALMLILYVAATNIGGLLDSLLRSIDRFALASLRIVVQQVIALAAGVLTLEFAHGLTAFAAALAGAAIVANTVGHLFLRRAVPTQRNLAYRPWRSVLSGAHGLSRLYLLLDVYWRADVVLLGLIVGSSAVARYSVAYRIILLYLGFQSAIELAAFGPMRRAAVRSSTDFSAVTNGVLGLVLLVSGLVSVTLLGLAQPIVGVLYSSRYSSSAPVLAVIASAIAFMSAQRVFNQALVALEREAQQVRAFTLVVLAGLVINAVFVPLWSVWSAAGVIVGTEIALFSLYGLRLRRVPGGRFIWRTGLRGMAAWGVGMAAAGVVLAAGGSGLGAAASGVASLTAVATLLGVVTRASLAALLGNLERSPATDAYTLQVEAE